MLTAWPRPTGCAGANIGACALAIDTLRVTVLLITGLTGEPWVTLADVPRKASATLTASRGTNRFGAIGASPAFWTTTYIGFNADLTILTGLDTDRLIARRASPAGITGTNVGLVTKAVLARWITEDLIAGHTGPPLITNADSCLTSAIQATWRITRRLDVAILPRPSCVADACAGHGTRRVFGALWITLDPLARGSKSAVCALAVIGAGALSSVRARWVTDGISAVLTRPTRITRANIWLRAGRVSSARRRALWLRTVLAAPAVITRTDVWVVTYAVHARDIAALYIAIGPAPAFVTNALASGSTAGINGARWLTNELLAKTKPLGPTVHDLRCAGSVIRAPIIIYKTRFARPIKDTKAVLRVIPILVGGSLIVQAHLGTRHPRVTRLCRVRAQSRAISVNLFHTGLTKQACARETIRTLGA